jgi:hypothetical protein
MYTDSHLVRVQDYILRNPTNEFYVFHATGTPRPELLGHLEFRTSPYLQKGSILVLDKEGSFDVVERLRAREETVGQHALFDGDDLTGLAAREAL